MPEKDRVEKEPANEVADGWADRTAPTLDDFEALASAAFNALPEEFRQVVAGVPLAVAEFAEDDVLQELDIESPFELMGLFHGVGLPALSDSPPTGQLPNRIFIYRRAILDYWAEHQEQSLGEIVTHVLVHEIGHHFGFSDDDMEALEALAQQEDDE